MKIIKTYEKYSMRNKKNYWLIPTDHRLHVALLKIGAPETIIKEILHFKEMKLNTEPFVYIGCNDLYNNDTWKWSSYDNGKGKNDFEKYDFIFKGEVNVEDYEIAALKHITG